MSSNGIHNCQYVKLIMDKNQIKKALAANGYDFSIVAAAIERSPSLISKVASRKARSRIVANAIAKAIGMPVQEVFPDIEDYHNPLPTGNSAREQKAAELAKLLND